VIWIAEGKNICWVFLFVLYQTIFAIQGVLNIYHFFFLIDASVLYIAIMVLWGIVVYLNVGLAFTAIKFYQGLGGSEKLLG
jgi:hypothetical protein